MDLTIVEEFPAGLSSLEREIQVKIQIPTSERSLLTPWLNGGKDRTFAGRVAGPFTGFDFSSQTGYRVPRPCVLCKGGSDTADTIGSAMSPCIRRFAAPIACTVSRAFLVAEKPFSAGTFRLGAERLKAVVPDSNYSRPCKERKDGASRFLVMECISRTRKGWPPAIGALPSALNLLPPIYSANSSIQRTNLLRLEQD